MYSVAGGDRDPKVRRLAEAFSTCGQFIPEVLHSAVGWNLSPAPLQLVWEHAYASPEAYRRYMVHPFHAAVLDRYLLADSPERVVTDNDLGAGLVGYSCDGPTFGAAAGRPGGLRVRGGRGGRGPRVGAAGHPGHGVVGGRRQHDGAGLVRRRHPDARLGALEPRLGTGVRVARRVALVPGERHRRGVGRAGELLELEGRPGHRVRQRPLPDAGVRPAPVTVWPLRRRPPLSVPAAGRPRCGGSPAGRPPRAAGGPTGRRRRARSSGGAGPSRGRRPGRRG